MTFLAACRRVPHPAAAVGADLLARWNEPHRHYHTERHLRSMLALVDAYATLAADPAQGLLAVWSHGEYGHVPEPDFRAGWARVLATLLDRPVLFRAVPDRAARTERAHRNLHRELAAPTATA